MCFRKLAVDLKTLKHKMLVENLNKNCYLKHENGKKSNILYYCIIVYTVILNKHV